MPPFVVVEGGDATALSASRAGLAAQGWQVSASWDAAAPGVVCVGVVDGEPAAQRAVLAAVAGAGLLLLGTASRGVLDTLYDDLRRLGPVEVRFAGDASEVQLHPEARALLDLLLAGSSLGAAAGELHISRRTADRRLAQARRAFGARTTSELLARGGVPGPATDQRG